MIGCCGGLSARFLAPIQPWVYGRWRLQRWTASTASGPTLRNVVRANGSHVPVQSGNRRARDVAPTGTSAAGAAAGPGLGVWHPWAGWVVVVAGWVAVAVALERVGQQTRPRYHPTPTACSGGSESMVACACFLLYYNSDHNRTHTTSNVHHPPSPSTSSSAATLGVPSVLAEDAATNYLIAVFFTRFSFRTPSTVTNQLKTYQALIRHRALLHMRARTILVAATPSAPARKATPASHQATARLATECHTEPRRFRTGVAAQVPFQQRARHCNSTVTS